MPAKTATMQRVDLMPLSGALSPWNGLVSALPVAAARPAGSVALAQVSPSLVAFRLDEEARKRREEEERRAEIERRNASVPCE
jgi:hypothetical protein